MITENLFSKASILSKGSNICNLEINCNSKRNVSHSYVCESRYSPMWFFSLEIALCLSLKIMLQSSE